MPRGAAKKNPQKTMNFPGLPSIYLYITQLQPEKEWEGPLYSHESKMEKRLLSIYHSASQTHSLDAEPQVFIC